VVVAMQRESERVPMDANFPQYEPVAMIRRRNSTKKYRPAVVSVGYARLIGQQGSVIGTATESTDRDKR
jgi:hypothetical protein